MKARTGPGGHPRRGAQLVVSLVVLMLVGALAAALTRGLLDARRQALLAERGAQAGLLADAGIGRARARLARDPSYAGETWDVPAADLGGAGAARVTIAVTAADGGPARRRVAVRAEFPRGATLRARSSRDETISLGPRPSGDSP